MAGSGAAGYHGAMNLGFPEMVFLFLLGLLLFGPRKLPELGRQFGKAIGEFKRASTEFQSQLSSEVRELEEEAERSNQPKASAPGGATARGELGRHFDTDPQTADEDRKTGTKHA